MNLKLHMPLEHATRMWKNSSYFSVQVNFQKKLKQFIKYIYLMPEYFWNICATFVLKHFSESKVFKSICYMVRELQKREVVWVGGKRGNTDLDTSM
jgi:hypothetical protein